MVQSPSAEARSSSSCNTVQLLLQLKQRLQHHDITLNLTEPGSLSRAIRAAGTIDDRDLQQYRDQLMHNMPSSDRVYLFANKRARMMCQRCETSFTISVPSQAGIANPQSVHCPCGALYLVGQQKRQQARKEAQFDGAYIHERNGDHTGSLVVENLSYGGIRLQLMTSHEIAEQDQLFVEFKLDHGQQSTMIRESVNVRYVQGNLIGVEFIDSQGLPQALVDYLRAS